MSISAELRQSARSAYRILYRASSSTFSGDEPVLKAFRSKMRQDALAARNETDPVAYQQYADQARDIATFLRRNVVQATRINDLNSADGEQLWKVHLTEHTELGDNESIRNPPKMESSRNSRRRGKGAVTTCCSAS
ncbi:hypothetical protein PM082_012996 [Marasmius tenuissimus]|nr:hypothetical protein PM082_012996 [Marasmius tenuissimus]